MKRFIYSPSRGASTLPSQYAICCPNSRSYSLLTGGSTARKQNNIGLHAPYHLWDKPRVALERKTKT